MYSLKVFTESPLLYRCKEIKGFTAKYGTNGQILLVFVSAMLFDFVPGALLDPILPILPRCCLISFLLDPILPSVVQCLPSFCNPLRERRVRARRGRGEIVHFTLSDL